MINNESYFSVGVLYSSQELIKDILNNDPIYHKKFMKKHKYCVASTKAIMKTVLDCGWIELGKDTLIVSNKGKKLSESRTMADALQKQIIDMITTYKPIWSALFLHNTSKEAYIFFPQEIKQCFDEAECGEGFWKEVIRVSKEVNK